MLEKTLECPSDCKEIKPVSTKGNQSWIFIERTYTEAKAPILFPPDTKNWFIGKDPDARRNWWQEEKKMAEDEMVGWHHWVNGHVFEQAPGDGGRQWNLMCSSPWSLKDLTMTEWLNLNEGMHMCYVYNIMITIHRSHWQIMLF